MKTFLKVLAIINIVLAPVFLITQSYFKFFLSVILGVLLWIAVKKGIYDKPLFSITEYAPTPIPDKYGSYKYVDVIRNQTYAYYIDYLFSDKRYMEMEKTDYEKDFYINENVDKFKFYDYPCQLVPNGNLYDVVVSSPIGTETIGTIPKDKLTETEYENGDFKIQTSGGRGWKIYESEDGKLKYSKEEVFPYKMKVKIKIDEGNNG